MKEELCGDEGTAKKTRKTKKSEEAAYYADLAKLVANFVRGRGKLETMTSDVKKITLRFVEGNYLSVVSLITESEQPKYVGALNIVQFECTTDLEQFDSTAELVNFQLKEQGGLMFWQEEWFIDLKGHDGIAESSGIVFYPKTHDNSEPLPFTPQEWRERLYMNAANGLTVAHDKNNRLYLNGAETKTSTQQRRDRTVMIQTNYRKALARIAKHFGFGLLAD